MARLTFNSASNQFSEKGLILIKRTTRIQHGRYQVTANNNIIFFDTLKDACEWLSDEYQHQEQPQERPQEQPQEQYQSDTPYYDQVPNEIEVYFPDCEYDDIGNKLPSNKDEELKGQSCDILSDGFWKGRSCDIATEYLCFSVDSNYIDSDDRKYWSSWWQQFHFALDDMIYKNGKYDEYTRYDSNITIFNKSNKTKPTPVNNTDYDFQEESNNYWGEWQSLYTRVTNKLKSVGKIVMSNVKSFRDIYRQIKKPNRRLPLGFAK